MLIEPNMSPRDRKRLIIALVVTPLLVALPSVWPHLHEPDFAARNIDRLLIFFALPYVAALWLAVRRAMRRH